MSITQRRNSQRLASTLDSLSSDLDFTASEIETATEEDMVERKKEYFQGMGLTPDEETQYLGQPNEDVEPPIEEDAFEEAFETAMNDEDDDPNGGNEEGSILQGDPGVGQFGSHSTFDTDNVRGLGSNYGVDFDGDSDLQSTIRNIPGRLGKKERIKKLIARIENVANEFEATGRKALAYRLDIVCNNLQAKYLNK